MKKIVIHNEGEKITGYTNFYSFRGDPETALIFDVEDTFNMDHFKIVNSELIELSEAEKTAVDLLPAIEEKHKLITMERDKRILAGFQCLGFQIQADPGSQAIAHQYLTKHIAGNNIFPLIWRTMDNQYLTMESIETFNSFTDAMSLHINTQFSESWTAKDNIDSAATVEEVEAIFNNYMGA